MNFSNLYQLIFEQDEYDDQIIYPDDPDSTLTDDLPFQIPKQQRTRDTYQITNLSITIPELDINRKVSFNIIKNGNKFDAVITQNWGEDEGEDQITTHPSKFAALSYIRNYRKNVIDSLRNAIDEIDTSDEEGTIF